LVRLLSWEVIDFAIEQYANKLDTGMMLAYAKARTIDSLLISDEEYATDELLGDALVGRVLPSLGHIIERLPDNSTVIDLGAGRGRHTLCALRNEHEVIAVERKAETFADLTKITKDEFLFENLTLIIDDYLNIDPTKVGFANLAIATGMLQHSRDREELTRRLSYIKYLAGEPGASIFIELLHDV
jgi:hypothetical protein